MTSTARKDPVLTWFDRLEQAYSGDPVQLERVARLRADHLHALALAQVNREQPQRLARTMRQPRHHGPVARFAGAIATWPICWAAAALGRALDRAEQRPSHPQEHR